LVKSLLTHQRITTTFPRAKEATKLLAKLITLGKADSLHARRRADALLNDRKLTATLFKEIAPRFDTQSGGYSRIIHLGYRRGDSAQLVVWELTKLKDKKEKALKRKSVQEGVKKEETEKPVDTTQKEDAQETVEEKQALPEKKPKGFLKGLRTFLKKQ
jgi:large subunit ribosomal protein L17